jgi:predicted ATPase
LLQRIQSTKKKLAFHEAVSTYLSAQFLKTGAFAGYCSQITRQFINELYDVPTRNEPTISSEKNIHHQKTQRINTTTTEGLIQYREQSQYIEKITIENIGPISKLEFKLTHSESTHAPCFALLGINGVGKSTVLRAIALALGGEQYAKRLGITAQTLLPNAARYGKITVMVSGDTEPFTVTVNRNKKLLFTPEMPKALVVAYGASRLLAKGRHKPKPGMQHAKIDNLFDPFLPIADAGKWLSQTDKANFNDAAITIKALLPIGNDIVLIQPADKNGAVTIKIGDAEPRQFNELSHGYQALLGLAVDVMDVMYNARFESMQAAQGVVLIDELENHLHPSWKMRIVAALRTAFPYVQVIFSTHDPLCLRGLNAGEVAILKRDRTGHVYALEDVPSVAGMYVDQLLTSEYFGLDSTLDPASEEKVKRFETLEQISMPTAAEAQERKELLSELSELRLLGRTRRERMLLELLDLDGENEVLPKTPGVSAKDLSAATLTRLKAVLGSVTPAEKNGEK